MLISDLQNQLRILVRERIAAGELTGTELARRAGFQQAHVSNFLNARRGFSIETMDRVMEVMRLDVDDLMPEPRRRIATAGGEAGFESVPLVEPSALLHREFSRDDVVEVLHFKKTCAGFVPPWRARGLQRRDPGAGRPRSIASCRASGRSF